ncbi:MAG: extracellular solute-binding protein [Acetobacteraceae bacterium]|nr:extracellular solute-binding protein [Acetobacteraceae bacterium]
MQQMSADGPSSRRGRRSTLALALAGALLACAPALAADLTVAAFGGAWEKALRECYAQPFERASGKSVAISVGNPDQWLNQIAASPQRPPLDVVVLGLDALPGAMARNLLDPLDAANLPNMAQFGEAFVSAGRGYAAIMNYGGMGVLYNRSAVRTPPATWKEFVEGTIAGKWRAAIAGVNYPYSPLTTIWLLAHVYGGSIDNVDVAFQKIKEMRRSGNLVFWSDNNQVLNQLQSGEIDIASYWDGRAWAFIDAGHSDYGFAIPAPGAPVSPSAMAKVRNGSPLAWQFLNTAMSAEAQSCFGNTIQYGVANRNAVFRPDVKPHITPPDQLLWAPFDEIARHTPAWVERWNKEIGG